jgi:carboxypeptidase Q
MLVEVESEQDLKKYRGKVAGKILFLNKPREIKDGDQPLFRRYSEDELSHLTEFPIPGERDRAQFRERYMKRWKLGQALNEFLVDEKALATVEASSRDNGLVRVGGGGSREVGGNPGVTALVMAAEHYNWILRLMKEDDQDVQLRVEVSAQFYDDDTNAYNTVAEIPGTDKNDEIVMLGGHLDSWHSGTGATDDAAGCAVAMEAVRILKALNVRPRRTIRIALWGGEEQGLLGSRAYVSEHFASRPEPTDEEQKKMPAFLREQTGPRTLKPEHARLSAYFNLDNGSGKIRGIYTQENAAVEPIFEAWLAPFADLGADTLSSRNTGGTDHLSFDSVGLPGFQFIQDPLDYSTITHHTTMDVYDHLRRDDLIQASAIMASFVYHAAMRTDMMPRKPMPREESKKAATEND